MPSPSDLMQMWASFDPYGSVQQGLQAPIKADIQRMQLEGQRQMLQEDLASQSKAPSTPTGAQGGLAKMQGSVANPDWKMETPAGDKTTAYEYSKIQTDSARDNAQADSLDAQAQKLIRQSVYADTAEHKSQILNQASEIANRSSMIRKRADEKNAEGKKLLNDASIGGLIDVMGAKDQSQLDEARNRFTAQTGMPVPDYIPNKYDPDKLRSLLNNASISEPVRKAVRAELDKQDDEAFKRKMRPLQLAREATLAREGGGSQGFSGPVESDADMSRFVKSVNAGAVKSKHIDTAEAKSTLTQINPQYRTDLDTPEAIKDVGNKLDVARRAYEISDFAKSKNITTGKFGELYKSLDAYDSTPASKETVSKFVANQELGKMILDYANAYARAESGRNIATVAELKAAMATFGEKGMSGRSTRDVFNAIGKQKEDQVANQYFGGKSDAVNLRRKKVESTSETPSKTSSGVPTSNW